MINNIKNVSVLSVLSLIVSVVALILYATVFENPDVFVPWIISSVMAVILPIVSKYFRNRKEKTGKTIEITAFVIGAFDFYCVFFAATKINIYIVFLIIAIISILYAKLFNYVMAVPKRKDTENDSAKKIKMTNFPMFFCIVSCACTIFLTIDALITTGELDNYGNWFAIFVLYCLPLILFNKNRKKNKRSLAIFLFVV